mgnify:FL=1
MFGGKDQITSVMRIDTMADWLSAHQTTARSLRKWLRELRVVANTSPRQPEPVCETVPEQPDQPEQSVAAIDPDQATQWVKTALRKASRRLDRLVNSYDRQIELIVDVDCALGDQAFTKSRQEQGSGPLCYVPFRGTLSDVILLAHEYTHGLQSLASDTHMPALARETCAFLGEFIVAQYLHEQGPDLHAELEMAITDDNAAYLGTDVESLYLALRNPDADYDYRWNYPLARSMARWIRDRQPNFDLAALLKSGHRALGLLPFELKCENANDANWLPKYTAIASGTRSDLSANLRIYQQLGAMVLLDSGYDIGECERSIADYWEGLLAPLKRGDAYLQLDAYARPIGYATWRRGTARHVHLTRQCAPFADQRRFLEGLRQQLKNASVTSLHPGTAEPEQSPW